MRTHTLSTWLVSMMVGLMWAGSGTLADEARTTDVVEGVAIYLGVVPAEVVRGHHPPDHPEAEMHDGVPEQGYHVMVALFEDDSGERITGAEVQATVSGRGMARARQELEPMVIADAETYGNYFDMTGPGPYRIALWIRLPDKERELRTTLTWERP